MIEEGSRDDVTNYLNTVNRKALSRKLIKTYANNTDIGKKQTSYKVRRMDRKNNLIKLPIWARHTPRSVYDNDETTLPEGSHKINACMYELNSISNKMENVCNIIGNDKDKKSEMFDKYVSNEQRYKKNLRYIRISVNNFNTEVMIDPESSISIISYDIFKKLWPKNTILKTEMMLKNDYGQGIKPIGKSRLLFFINDDPIQHSVIITEHTCNSSFVLGMDWLTIYRCKGSRHSKQHQSFGCIDNRRGEEGLEIWPNTTKRKGRFLKTENVNDQ